MTSSIDKAALSADRTDRIIAALGEGEPSRQGGVGGFVNWSIKTALIIGLASLSWLATYTGMLELIRANAGTQDLGLGMMLAIGFAVAMLMLMIIYILDQLFTDMTWWMRTLFIAGYIFLTLISVGFGFGFYWKFLEARSEATRSAEAAVTTVQGALQTGQTRLEQLAETLTALTVLSSNKAIQEREKGNTCPNSRPGDGPRRRLRDADAASFNVAAQFIGSRIAKIKQDIAALNHDLKLISSGAVKDPKTGRQIIDPKTGTRNAFLKDVSRRISLTINRFNSLRSDPQLKQYRDSFAERAAKSVFPNGRGGTFRCPDPHLQSALMGVVRAIDSLPVIKNPKVAAVEGSEAIIEAFRRLTTSFTGLLTFKLPPNPDELRELQRQAVQKAGKNSKEAAALLEQSPGLGHRDYIPLFVAIFVDFCLLLVSINRPIYKFRELKNLVAQARAETLRGLLLDYYHVSHGEQEKQFEQLQHVIFDFGGDYYAAVPLNSEDKDARYLATLFAALEGKGVVKRGLFIINLFGLSNFFVRHKLRRQNSRFANENVFRLYRFYDGAWSELVRNVSLEAAAIEKARQAELAAKKEAEQKQRDEMLRREREEQLQREREERELRHKLELAQIEKGLKELGIGPRYAKDPVSDVDIEPSLQAASAAPTDQTKTEPVFSAQSDKAGAQRGGDVNGHTIFDDLNGFERGGDGQAAKPVEQEPSDSLSGAMNGNGHDGATSPTNGHASSFEDMLRTGENEIKATAAHASTVEQEYEDEVAATLAQRLAASNGYSADFKPFGATDDVDDAVTTEHRDHRDRVNFDLPGPDLPRQESASQTIHSENNHAVDGLKALADRLAAQKSKNAAPHAVNGLGGVAPSREEPGDLPEPMSDPVPQASNPPTLEDPILADVSEPQNVDDTASVQKIAEKFSRSRKIAEMFKPEIRDYDDEDFDDPALEAESEVAEEQVVIPEPVKVFSFRADADDDIKEKRDANGRPTLTLVPETPDYGEVLDLADHHPHRASKKF